MENAAQNWTEPFSFEYNGQIKIPIVYSQTILTLNSIQSQGIIQV